ncbi:MAG: lipopolysaccharide heptosyltransferase II [Leptospira sp.]|nr:lipopolysaccharide heptosyltransferase II [Leptospira sp.]NCS94241.1 lipopolysaccharide heptosyltransferase II [Leptospira sp.]
MNQPSKILIIQTAFLGDLILTTAFFQQVRKHYPQAQIDVIVNKGTETVLAGSPDIDNVIPLNKKEIKKNLIKFFIFLRNLRKANYELVFCPHFSFRSSLMSWATGAHIRIGYKESGFSFLHTQTVSRPTRGPHEVNKLFSLLWDDEYNFPRGRDARPILYLNDEDFGRIALKLNKNPSEFIVLAASSLWETKRYPEEGFIGLARSILQKTHYSIVLIGSKSDTALTKNIYQGLLLDRAEWADRILDLAGETSLQELAYIISKSKIVISNDSSPVHFASAFNIPTLLIYGATIPEFGYSSLAENHIISEISGLSCRPCGIHGGTFCPVKHFRCMNDQRPEMLFEKFKILQEGISKANT